MTRILILGGGGMLGQKLAWAIARDGLGEDPAPEVRLMDIAFPENGAPAAVQAAGNVTDAVAVRDQLSRRPDVIFHLAAVVSGEAEADFDLGWAVNLHAFWTFLEAVRAEHAASGGTWVPRVVFTSSIAVFGAPYPEKIGDEFLTAPLTSYGAQKACAELMLGDVSRRGIMDGVALRLPTICVRPGRPNRAASGFFSNIIREPLAGREAVLPAPEDVRHWFASPRAAVGFMTRAAVMDTAALEGRRALTLPGLSCTVAEQIAALRDVAGEDVAGLIRREPDPVIMKIVEGWPRDFDAARARALGFEAERDFREIIRVHLEDEHGKA